VVPSPALPTSASTKNIDSGRRQRELGCPGLRKKTASNGGKASAGDIDFEAVLSGDITSAADIDLELKPNFSRRYQLKPATRQAQLF